MKIFISCFLSFLFLIHQFSSVFAADQSADQPSVSKGEANLSLQPPERNLIKTGGAINKQLGGALSEYGQQRGGLIGMGARVSGSIYTATGTAIEDVADNKKSVVQAHNDTFKAAVTAHKKEVSGSAPPNPSPTPKVAQKHSQIKGASPAVGTQRNTAAVKTEATVQPPATPPLPEPSEEQRYVALLQSPDDETRRSALKEIHTSQMIYNRTVLDTAEKILLEQHMEDKGAVFSDSMSWICRVLGDSGERKYLGTLRKVAVNGSTWRLRMHAINSRDKLTSGSPPNNDNSLGSVEERLQRLSKLQQNGLITQEEYNSKRNELIKQL
ncbi:MAG: SHOCT domain-containing protein [Desulforhopalus sp.]|nr:SHOCT domain-containing protein [Desulforhopalus sp.]